MTIYLLIFSLLLFAAFIETFGKKNEWVFFLFIAILILLFIATFRVGIGTDYYNYLEIYKDVTINKEYNVELGFVFLNSIASFIGGYKILLFLVTLINLISLIFVLRRFQLNLSVGILTYYSIFFLNHNFNVLRHGLMSTLIWISFCLYYQRKKIKAFFFLLISFLFHQLAIIIFSLRFLTNLKVNLIISWLLFIGFYFLGNMLSDFFIFANLFISEYNNKLNFYLNDYNGDEIIRYKFGFGFFMYVLVYSLLNKYGHFFSNRKLIEFFNIILFLAICIICIFASFSIFSERVANTLLFSIIFIFSSISYLKIKITPKLLILFIIAIIDFLYLMKNLSIPGFNREFQFVPFTYSLFN
jgi:hypothetical protein